MDRIVLPSRVRETSDALTPSVSTSAPVKAASQPTPIEKLSSPRDVLSILKAKPDMHALRSCLDFLSNDDFADDSFHVRRPGPLASQIIFALVNETTPAYWQVLSKSHSQRKPWRQLVKCLRSNAGLAAATNRLKILSNPDLRPAKLDSHELRPTDIEDLRHSLELLECILHGDDILHFLWSDLARLEPQKPKRAVIAEGIVGLVASGNVLSVAAQADMMIRGKSKELSHETWISDGRQFSLWLGRNILHMSTKIDPNNTEAKQFRISMLSKGLGLGHKDQLVGVIFSSQLKGISAGADVAHNILNDLPRFLQPAVTNVLLRLLSDKQGLAARESSFVSGAAALLKALLGSNEFLLDHMVSWTTKFVGGNVGFAFEIFRAIILLLSEDPKRLKSAFQSTLEYFGSKNSIQHSPMLQQETQTKVLLLSAGYLHRLEPNYLKQVKSTSLYLNAISNRLAASSARLQFFGMAVGMSISELVDSADATLKFDTEEIKGEEGVQLRDLVKLKDTLGSISDLQLTSSSMRPPESRSSPVPSRQVKTQPVQEIRAKIVAIEEIESESEDDLPIYAKPDSDPEDSDSDPTAINRNKPTAPVYIRDLLAGLHDDQNYDRHKLAVDHAAPLIRRKTHFGTEVLDHIEELAAKLVGLRDAFDFEKFHEKRLQAMIAVVIAKPVDMGKWYANTYFNGDYSMSQRAAILSALALAARELAGLKDEDADMTGVNEVPDFPSKRLPEKYAKMYSLEAAPINKLTGKLERDIIKPMALQAADKATGPNILKVRTFSSRMEVEKKRKRPIPNELSKVVADGFFYPLTGRLSSVIRARGDSSVFTSPFLLSQFIRTIALILSAAGASTMALPGMTTELWSLLLSLRRFALAEQSVLEALLFANLTLLEINSNDQRRLAEDHAQELMETQAWVQPVFENLRGGPKEEERVKMLASALLVKVKEVIDNYQSSLLGRS